MKTTRLRGARTNNLKGIDLAIEPGTFLAIVGPSGAGKSSLAFATLYAEGQRRYVESFSAYARQFLERMSRPPVDELDPVPVGIAVDRQAPIRTSRSTVGTRTEIADYAKTLFARSAELFCPDCGDHVKRDAPVAIAEELITLASSSAIPNKLVITYPVDVGDPASEPERFVGVREALVSYGYRRAKIGDAVRDLDAVRPSDVSGSLDVVADRTTAREKDRSRLVEALEAAMTRGKGRVDVWPQGGEKRSYSRSLHCARCDRGFRDPVPAMFSFNNPLGACATCRGFGRTIGIDLDKALPDPSLSIKDGAVRCFQGKAAQWERRQLLRFAKRAGVPTNVPLKDLSEEHQTWLVDGDPEFDPEFWDEGWFGIRHWFKWMESRAYKMHVRVFLSRYRSYDTCATCAGTRLMPDALAWKVDGRTLPEIYALPSVDALEVFRSLAPKFRGDAATTLLLSECERRLTTLVDVGLGYLSLDRGSRTLSGGEAQRVALTSALGASLNGAMFVLDEPTVGLHPRDVSALRDVVRGLAKGDNVAIVVEHDPDMIAGADRVIELGPAAGERGGQVVFDGTPAQLMKRDTATGRALRAGAISRAPRATPTRWLTLSGATGHNLKNVDVKIPLARLTTVTGVSGSGKSSLIRQTLEPAVARALGQKTSARPLPFSQLAGHESLTSVVGVDQSPLGRTSRGNPATYLKAWDAIRKRLVATPLAKERKYTPGTFSFNVPGGRCETCGGEGAETVEMQFLADVTFECPDCKGARFVGPVLDVNVHGENVASLLKLTADEAIALFEGDRLVLRALAPLARVGLGYLRLGQPLNTLSGGEAQRLKLAGALKSVDETSLVIFDEPSAGLHRDDIAPLIDVMHELVERGATVLVVEHDMNIAASSDYVIDLGPGAAGQGGAIVAQGSPKDVARSKRSLTAPFLADARNGEPPKLSPRRRQRASKSDQHIVIARAREHNLKDVTVELPRNALVVVTGPSGSGKSTLAFDVLFAEGQRRYLETLSPYARQYMPQLPRPAVDRIAGVPPCVSLEQRITRGGATSTVATITEVAHYLRVLYARAGTLYCPDCDVKIEARSPHLIASDLASRHGSRALRIYAPVVSARKGNHRELLDKARKRGVTHAYIDGEDVELASGLSLSRYHEHDIALLVETLAADDARMAEALTNAMRQAGGAARIRAQRGKLDELVSSARSCASCGQGFPELDPRFFSFNTKQGGCAFCEGRGAIAVTQGRGKNKVEVLTACADCEGTRLSPLARSVLVDDRPIEELLALSVDDAGSLLAKVTLKGREATIGRVPVEEAKRRLSFLSRVGLGYLGLDRAANTLSGGEMQRVRLAAQLGAGLTGVLYVLDEPTIGLHPRDTGRLLEALRALVDRGNSVVVVEHDADTILAADHVVDIGPGGGRHGGTVVAQGAPALIEGVTVPALRRAAPVPEERRPVDDATPRLVLTGARAHNLKDVTLKIPLGRFVTITGVSGSGKSTLVREVLLRAVRRELGLVADAPLAFKSVSGVKGNLKRAIEIDQSPIGRTPRSVPATYINAWATVRQLLAGTTVARERGYTATRFSFNTADGRCAVCGGHGARRVEMAFLPDVHVPCEGCAGARFDEETNQVTWRGRHAGELLNLEVREALSVFSSIRKVRRPLELMDALGLGYLKLGQPSNTLSGGEAQRMKLVSELNTTKKAGPTLYVMDEPTTGLHRDDIARLLDVMKRLVERGDTVVVIEHHPDVMVASDWIVDLGPEGGGAGGTIVCEGAPETVARHRTSHTARVIRAELKTAKKPMKRKASTATKPATKPAKKTAKKTAKKSAKKPAKKSAKKPAKKPAKKSAKRRG